ncbi:MAG: GntR family transcriptional regulator [Clostridiales bacterium]|nr:GntR family transcriptional regulator [Clostridiales bacterium]
MLLQLELESNIPIYKQIANQIIVGIAKGELTEGEELPSVRQMASDIGINMHTVNKAYSNLKQAGWVIIHRKKGVLICTSLKSQVDNHFVEILRDSLEVSIAEAFLKGVTKDEFTKLIEEKYAEYRGGNSQ